MLLGSTRTTTIITGGKQRMLETGRNDKNVKAKYTSQVCTKTRSTVMK